MAKEIGPAEVPTTLPAAAQPALERYIAQLRAVLDQYKGTASNAYCNQHLDDPQQPAKSAVGGSSLRVIPYEAIDDSGAPKPDAFRELAELSLAAELVIQRIEIRFQRDKRGWQHEMTIETAENHKRLTKARKPLDDEIAAAAAALAAAGEWDKAMLSFDATKDPALTFLILPSRVKTAAPESLQALFARVEGLHTRFGQRLRTATWSVERAKPGKVFAMTFYG